LAIAVFFIYVFAPLVYWVLRRLELGGFEGGINKLARLPIWYLVLAVFIGGASEEILYRGYAVERISSLSGSYWIGGLVPLLFFGLAHVPMWGWGPALTTFVSGAILTLFYIWQQDLLANIVAHVITDFTGIVMPPLLARMRLS
jgi:membrane protease YdiL (CAAX protease family)